MEVGAPTSGTEPPSQQRDSTIRPNTIREKTKRPQLSCNPCRSRKVKCDRIQPCTACSLHQIAGLCQYDLTETERQPILQAEALKEKDKVIAHLRHDLQQLQGQPHVKMEPRDDDLPMNGTHRIPTSSIAPTRPLNIRQRRFQGGMLNDSIYFGTPGTTGVVEEFANLSVNGQPANLTHLVPRGADMAAFQIQPTNPFPTFWRTAEGTSALINLLPKDQQETLFYINTFQRRAQSCSFPHLPDQCTEVEVQRFLSNVKENSEQHPDMLALTFATLAQGVQNGVYDKYGGAWHGGVMEIECRMGNAFIAASMQCLRLASFCNRPKLLTVETLVMLGPYLTNSGRFLDAWALFGTTIRLAQSIGLHRDPDRLNPPVPAKEAAARRGLWWWIMYMDQQYSITLGRPLGISSMGDCPPPEPLVQDPLVQSHSNYISQFTILTRQILSAGYLNANQIDDFTEQLLALKRTLPNIIQFDETWLNSDKPVPGWPLDMQAATLHAKTHTYILLLNRQRPSGESNSQPGPTTTVHYSSRGRHRVLQSCRAVLHAFDFLHTRVPAGLVCWTTGQQAFNAAMLLVYAMLETNEATDLEAVQRAYTAFLDMQRLGIHRLAGAAVDRLGGLLKEVPSGETPREAIMGPSGMLLLEDPGLQGFLDGGFSPLSFHFDDNPPPLDRPRKQRRTTTNKKEPDTGDVKPAITARTSKASSQPKAHSGRGAKPRPISTSKTASRTSRPTMRQRHSGLPSPSMTEPSDRMQIPTDITQWPLDSSSLNSVDMAHHHERNSPPLISPNQAVFGGFPTNEFDTPTPMAQSQSFNGISRAHTTFPEGRPGFPHRQTGSDPIMHAGSYSTQLTPHDLTPTDLTPTEIANGAFQTTPRLDFATYGHFTQPQMHQQTPLNTPPFSAFSNGDIPCSYPGQY
ncbi:MAG: hypothetical protein L6R42_004808 [Xanthoria sp. 1 TBL-2021]|nr:MAG: hypothetical protein L6R42_004808 [Xanthoria sp. 1 TBL-2021]